MKRITITLAVVGLLLAGAVPAGADGVTVWVDTAQESVWGFNYQHVNPCTGNPVVIHWEAEHRNMMVDHDGDTSGFDDQHKSGGVMNVLWATHSESDWVVDWVGDSFAQNGWDEVVWFADEDQATVIYRVRAKAHNTVTGESYQSRHFLRWISNGQGETIFGQGSQTNQTTVCHTTGKP